VYSFTGINKHLVNNELKSGEKCMLIPIFENGKKIHQDSSGNKYQYDLTNSMDQFSYSTDLSAQMRDKSSITTTRNPNGGGIYE
ncbi:TPA: hypothetical protein ACUMYS_001688, partial [Haemophilus influenzae]